MGFRWLAGTSRRMPSFAGCGLFDCQVLAHQRNAQARDYQRADDGFLIGLDHLAWRVATPHLHQALGILEDFGIAHLAQRNMQSLSGGQQQLVLLMLVMKRLWSSVISSKDLELYELR